VVGRKGRSNFVKKKELIIEAKKGKRDFLISLGRKSKRLGVPSENHSPSPSQTRRENPVKLYSAKSRDAVPRSRKGTEKI